MILTYSVKALPRADKQRADGTQPIYFFLRVSSYTAKIPSGKHIHPSEWDKKNACPKKTTKQGQLLATFFNQKISGFETFMLLQQTLGKPITITVALTYFKEDTAVTLFGFWENQMSLWEHTHAENTLKSYRSTLKILKEFNPRLNFGDLTPMMIDRFDKFMNDKRGNSVNGRFAKHKNLKSVINQAIRKGYMKDNPYRSFKIRSTNVRREFLTIEEIRHLMMVDLPEDKPILYKVRNIFLFSCFTGLRYSDVMNLRISNVKLDMGHPRIEFTVNKTNRAQMVPLSTDALRLIQTYTAISNKSYDKLLFPPIANPTINRGLKDLMEVAGIDKWISFHCGRHSFASNLVEIGTSIIHIKDLLGHRKLDQTQIYAKANKNDLFEPMSKLNKMYINQ
ncbi:MAG TPA: site-specific integrase [Candidatus Babeliaceae bacterium]|nr:site-specific integrase [Candidatus Babeliaceae bacterium]